MTDLMKLPSVDRFRVDEETANRALVEFIDWCSKNQLFLEQGRKYGFRLAVSPAVKDAIALQLKRDEASRINANLLDVE